MRFRGLILVLIALLIAGFSSDRKIHVLNFEAFEPHLHTYNDTTYIINFWASWCIPCRKEMPDLEQISKDYNNQKVKLILVSLDFPNDMESRLIPYLDKNNIESQVILLDDPHSNYWINRVDSSWSGAIPATVIYNKNFREFYEKDFNYHELDSIINRVKM